MTDARRPTWDWKLTEGEFRKLTARHVVRINHGWRFLTADTSESWIELTTADNGSSDKCDTVRIPSHRMAALLELFRFAPDYAGLLRLTSEGVRAAKRLAEIADFERKHDRDRQEYERLKRKFENGPPQ